MYLDVNNLYGWETNHYLTYTYSKYEWLNQKKINKSDINLINDNTLDGYMLEVDLQ